MRKATIGIVGLASIASIAASWTSGLHPRAAALAGVHVISRAGSDAHSGTKPGVNGGSSPSPTPSGKGSGGAQPRSGSVTGDAVQTPYGDVQVEISFSGRRITNVHAVHLTDSSSTSVSISAGAAPVLRQEAIAAQSAQIDMVSGATYTSEGYIQSLQSAIDAAHLA